MRIRIRAKPDPHLAPASIALSSRIYSISLGGIFVPEVAALEFAPNAPSPIEWTIGTVAQKWKDTMHNFFPLDSTADTRWQAAHQAVLES